MGKCQSQTSSNHHKQRSEDRVEHREIVHSPTTNIADDYEVLEYMSESTNSEVTLCRHRATGIKRVIKKVNTERPSQRKKVLDRVSLLKEIDHPNIIQVVEVYETPLCVYVVMEHCSGGDLLDRASRDPPLSEEQISQYVSQILSALAYLHSHQIVHRDVKPSKVLLTHDGDDASLKLYNFTCASKLTKSEKLKEIIGSDYYIAPEVLNGSYDEKCDIWSVGIITYFLLCGQPPFYATESHEIFRKILTEPITVDPSLNLSSKAVRFLGYMLERDPAARPSANQLLEKSWIQHELSNDQVVSAVFENLKAFNCRSKLEKATLSMIAHELLTHEETEQLNRVYAEADKDHDGHLTKNELKRVFKQHGLHMRYNLDEIIARCDLSQDGLLSYNEFLTSAVNWRKALSKERLQHAFEAFDLDHNGVLTPEELASVFGQGPHDFSELFQTAEKFGQVTFQEFEEYIRRSQ